MTTDRTLIDRARAAVPGWAELDRARREATSTRATVRDTRTDGGAGALVDELADLLASGKALPSNLAERAHTARTTAAQRRADLLTTLREVERVLHERADRALTEGIGDALDVLAAELDGLVSRTRPALAVLGDIRDAGAAIDAGAETAEAWRTVSAAAAAYVDLRRAHARIVTEAIVSTRPERDGGGAMPSWGPRRLRPEPATLLVGHYATDTRPYDGPDAGVPMLAALLADDAPVLGVPGPDEVRERAEALDRAPEPDADERVVVTPRHPFQPRPAASDPAVLR